MKDIEIQWHPGFVAAMNLELADDRDKLTYEKEYNLNRKPLEIDLLVIKKDRNLRITNEIGKIFRGHNIMEYKSPQDHLNIDTFYKTGAYASLYKAYGETVDERTADNITVSIVREVRPEGLFRYFNSHGIRMTNPYKGIYLYNGCSSLSDADHHNRGVGKRRPYMAESIIRAAGKAGNAGTVGQNL